MFEHLDRLGTYAQVREKVISLVQISRGAEAKDCSNLESCGQWEEQQWWDNGEEEQWPQEDGEDADIGAISADTICHNCGGKGHFARTCSTPSTRDGKGKGGKAIKGSGKGGKKGGKTGYAPRGKGYGEDTRVCDGCGKKGHIKATCFQLHPELKTKGKRVQGVDEEGAELGYIQLCSVETISSISPVVVVGNSFSELKEEGDPYGHMTGIVGGSEKCNPIMVPTARRMMKLRSRRVASHEWRRVALPSPVVKTTKSIERIAAVRPGSPAAAEARPESLAAVAAAAAAAAARCPSSLLHVCSSRVCRAHHDPPGAARNARGARWRHERIWKKAIPEREGEGSPKKVIPADEDEEARCSSRRMKTFTTKKKGNSGDFVKETNPQRKGRGRWKSPSKLGGSSQKQSKSMEWRLMRTHRQTGRSRRRPSGNTTWVDKNPIGAVLPWKVSK